MTATALAGFNGDVDGGYFVYHTFGVAAAEVEVDCCTGERQLLRADMMFDAGRSVNPAVDLGQVTWQVVTRLYWQQWYQSCDDGASILEGFA